MATTKDALLTALRRLKVRGDTFLDSDGEALLAELKAIALSADATARVVKEIEHRRSEKIE